MRTFIACFGPGTTLGCQDRSRAKPVEEIPHQFWSRDPLLVSLGTTKITLGSPKITLGSLGGSRTKPARKILAGFGPGDHFGTPGQVQGKTGFDPGDYFGIPGRVQRKTGEANPHWFWSRGPLWGPLAGPGQKTARKILASLGPGDNFGVPGRGPGQNRQGNSSPVLVHGTTLGSQGESRAKLMRKCLAGLGPGAHFGGQNQRGISSPVLVQGTTLGSLGGSRARPARNILAVFWSREPLLDPWGGPGQNQRGKSSPVLVQGTTLGFQGESMAKLVREFLAGFGPWNHFGVPGRVQGKPGEENPRWFCSRGSLWGPLGPGQNRRGKSAVVLVQRTAL